MSSQPPLIVPVQVDALLVNDGVLRNETFHRWHARFDRLDKRQPPEPDPYDTAASDPNPGIHLQWLIPDALRRGRQDGPAGRVKFPFVPNRWLVVRYSRPADQPDDTPSAAGWIVDSDCLGDDGETPFLDPWADGLEPEWIGRVHDLGRRPWEEPEGRRQFLTAVGPGLPTFAMFQPYNENVFSFRDPLTGVDGPVLLSYLVVGWYSEATWDILTTAPGGNVRALLDSFRWSTADEALRPARSFYAGTALRLLWKRDGDSPRNGKPGVDETRVAVGHIAPDAETALHPATLDDPEAALLWEAFTYDLLDVLDEDEEHALDQATHRTWFGAEPGGYTWRVVDRPAPADGAWPQRTARQIDDERQWLAELNATQAEHDHASRELASLQQRLYGLWWLRGRERRPGQGWDTACDNQLDPDWVGPDEEKSVAGQVREKLTDIFGPGGLRSRIPWGDTAEELADAVAEYGHEPAPGRELQRCAEPEFHRVPDPTVIVSGAKLDRPLTDEQDLSCRTVAETVSAVRIREQMVEPPSELPRPDLTRLPEPALLAALLGEFYLLDRAAVTPGRAPGKTALDEALEYPGANVTGTLARWTRSWERQPWSPLFVIWKTNVYPTPYRSAGEDNWEFDGTGYRWKGSNAVTAPTALSGRAMLNPLPGFNTRARLAQHAATHPRGPVAKLLELRQQADDWDMLSQSLDGTNDWLAQHSPSTNIAPVGALGDLTDTSKSRVSLSEVPDPGPGSAGDGREFRPVRAGQFTFEELLVVDRFGQSLAIISTDNVRRYPVERADSVTPDITVHPDDPDRWVELPPRILQPARLRFDFVSARDDQHRIDVDAGPGEADGQTPLCGWLLANRLSNSLLVLAPDGRGLGEIRTVLDTAHRQIAVWSPLPGSPYPDVEAGSPSEREFAADLPHLHGFVTELLDPRRGAPAFAELLAVVDAAMSATAPGGDDDSLAALAGRPLALLRARLGFELDGPAMTSSSWGDVVAPPAPEFTDYLWNVRLGAADMLGDGLAGFYADTDYTRLHSVAELTSPQYAVPVDGQEIAIPARPAPGPAGAGNAEAAWVTLLADPWAAVHAVTDILPVGRLLLPPTWVREPLSRIKLSFRMGPLLAGTRAVPGEEGDAPVEHVVMPGPSGWRGTWAWAEPTVGTRLTATGPESWTTLPLAEPDAALALSDAAPAARTGFLQLSGALGEFDESARRRPPVQNPPASGSTS
ncbi:MULTISPECIES: hypothetical protein [unclassified Streptomyces]|uniref:hypothetical protein n=1 Tax=unclassified Streptomyces TaxID=2593676 RepID=UPI0037FF9192